MTLTKRALDYLDKCEKDKSVLKRLNLDEIPNVFAEEGEALAGDYTYRYSVKCKANDLRHRQRTH